MKHEVISWILHTVSAAIRLLPPSTITSKRHYFFHNQLNLDLGAVKYTKRYPNTLYLTQNSISLFFHILSSIQAVRSWIHCTQSSCWVMSLWGWSLSGALKSTQGSENPLQPPDTLCYAAQNEGQVSSLCVAVIAGVSSLRHERKMLVSK